MGLQRIPLEGFAGINTRDGPYDLEPDESYDCLNVQPRDFHQMRGLKRRGGSALHADLGNTTSRIAKPLLYWPNKGLTFWSNHRDLFKVTLSTGAVTKIFDYTSGSPSSFDWEATIGFDLGVEYALFTPTVMDEVPRKYDGVTLSNWAGTPPQVPVAQGSHSFIGNGFWRGRTLVWNIEPNRRHRLFYSEVGDYELPAGGDYSNNWLDFMDDDSSKGIIDCKVHGDLLYVFKEKTVYQVYDPVTFANRIVFKPGVNQKNVIVSHPNGLLYWYAPDGQVYSSNGETAPELNTVKFKFKDYEHVDTVTQDPVTSMALMPNRESMLFGLRRSDGSGLAVRGAIEMYPKGKGESVFFPHNNLRANTLLTVEPTTDGPARLFGASLTSDGLSEGDEIVEMFLTSTNSDRGTSVDGYWRTSWRSFLSEEPLERLRRWHLIFTGKVDVDFYAEASPVKSPVSKKSESWDNSSTNRKFRRSRPETRGRYHQVKLGKNSTDSPFLIDKMEFVIRGGKEHTLSGDSS